MEGRFIVLKCVGTSSRPGGGRSLLTSAATLRELAEFGFGSVQVGESMKISVLLEFWREG
jgi:hypothetical protein